MTPIFFWIVDIVRARRANNRGFADWTDSGTSLRQRKNRRSSIFRISNSAWYFGPGRSTRTDHPSTEQMNLPSPSRLLEAAADARLYGTFREGFTIILGIAIVAVSGLLSTPQVWTV